MKKSSVRDRFLDENPFVEDAEGSSFFEGGAGTHQEPKLNRNKFTFRPIQYARLHRPSVGRRGADHVLQSTSRRLN